MVVKTILLLGFEVSGYNKNPRYKNIGIGQLLVYTLYYSLMRQCHRLLFKKILNLTRCCVDFHFSLCVYTVYFRLQPASIVLKKILVTVAYVTVNRNPNIKVFIISYPQFRNIDILTRSVCSDHSHQTH